MQDDTARVKVYRLEEVAFRRDSVLQPGQYVIRSGYVHLPIRCERTTPIREVADRFDRMRETEGKSYDDEQLRAGTVCDEMVFTVEADELRSAAKGGDDA